MKCEHTYKRNYPSGNKTHYAKVVCCECNKFLSWAPKGSPISTDLYVSFDEKDEAKKLGARWDKFHKRWFAPSEYHLCALEKYTK